MHQSTIYHGSERLIDAQPTGLAQRFRQKLKRSLHMSGSSVAVGGRSGLSGLIANLPTDTRLQKQHRLALTAAGIFLVSAVYYGLCLFPGLGGELNAGDSAKIQILGHTSILLHGPGYPIVLMLGALVRWLALPFPDWWTMTFALSAIPGAFANAMAFLIAQRLTGSTATGLAAAFLLGTAGLMTIQSTEAEVYALALAFILSSIFLLALFVETKRVGYFLAACAVYAMSFGNHLMMIMLVPVFLWVTIAHHRVVLRPRPIAAVLAFILVGASQYLYLAYIAYSPDTAYSEYMPLPPTLRELIDYIRGTYFSDLYGSGLTSTRTLEALIGTFRAAHPWLSLPLVLIGLVLFWAGWQWRDAGWYGLAVVFGAALAFVPFMLWYGAYDIHAFHLPVLGPSIVAAVTAIGWSLRSRPVLLKTVAVALLMAALVRAGHTALILGSRQPMFAGVAPAIEQIVAQAPGERPLVAMDYGLRMATLYHTLRGELPETPVYRVWWRAVPEIRTKTEVAGVVVPTDGYQFVRWIEHQRPDLQCRTREIPLIKETRWPAYAYQCQHRPRGSWPPDILRASVPADR